MVVCHCEVVSDRDVRAAIDAGAGDLDAVTDACGAAGNCGGCVPAVEDLLAEAALALRDPAALRVRQAARRRVPVAA
ncbi:(2Fe-2S)-binding protein [Nitriliruptoraceae bacterium ZYF776]|nr:(2Fe-2S)-binding protein [Profundirhabdus halotolerans]